MTSFINVEKSLTHLGVVRVEAGFEKLRALWRQFDSTRGLTALFLGAIVSSMLIVADQLVSAADEGSLLMLWMVMWAVAFAGLALFAGAARALAVRAVALARSAAKRRAARLADEKFLAYAQHDPRILSELNFIAAHQQQMDAEQAAAGKV